MKEDWIECIFEDLLDYEQPTKYIVESTKYSDDYKMPVLTAGKTFIKGYTNDTNGIFDNLPTIIFDDFTTASQYVDFKFKVKSSAMKILVPTSKLVNMKFTFNCMQANQVRNDTHKRYWISVYAKKEILLPSLAEQRAIVSKTEELFSDLDNGIANLKKAQEQLKIYRQAVLKKAFEGELTKEWREEIVKTPNLGVSTRASQLPTAEELLQQIKEERQNHYNQQIEDWKKAVKEWELAVKAHGRASQSKKPTKPKAIKELPPLIEEELKELQELPKSWNWCKIGDLGTVGTGATPKRGKSIYWENGNIAWITSGALNNEFVKECKEFVTSKALEETNIKIFPKHTLLMAMYGEGKTRGKSSELLIEATTNQAIAGIVQNGIEANTRKYLKLFLVKNYQDIRRKSSGGVQPNINLDIVKNTAIALCSLPEQIQIVQEIESRLSVCDKVEQSITESLEKANALRQSILKKAFEGKLLSEAEIKACKQEKDYEPASVLLEKIKAEKLAKEQEAKKTKKSKKNGK